MTDPRWQTVQDGLPYSREDAEEFQMPRTLAAYAALDALEAEMREMQRANDQLGEQADLQGAENERLREALRDYAERGVRADLNPTRKIPTPDSFWLSYLERIDRQVRDRARAALGGEE